MFSGLVKRKRVHQRVTAIRDRLYRTAYAWCHDRALAQDLVQDTALRAIENAAQLRDLKAVDAWIFTILANCHRSHLRRNVQTVVFDEDQADSPAPGLQPDQVFEAWGMIEQVKRALEGLNEEQRKVITLIDIEEFSYQEVASILEVPIGTVMSRLSRARQRLKKLLRTHPAPGNASVTYLRRNR